MRNFTVRSIFTFGACLILPSYTRKAPQKITKEKPNVVLIYADDLGIWGRKN
ncbi:MAG: hypothetical protein VB068_02335 [Petrimonas sp.]|nr:hypothetical protein [Petrimonas sp.]